MARDPREQLSLPLRTPDPGAAERLAGFFWKEGEGPPAPPPGRAEAPRREYLAVRLSGETYALPVERIREIQKPGVITEVPRAPARVLGVFSLRGEIVPVIDPRVRLGLDRQAPGRSARLVVLDPGDGPCGLWVDEVLGVVFLGSADIEPLPGGLAADPELITGIARPGGKLVALLDLDVLLGDVLLGDVLQGDVQRGPSP